MMKAAIYARFSSDRQREESIEDQVRLCRKYADENGYEVVKVYSDSAKTGRNDRRPGFQDAIAESWTYDVLLVYKLDRFSRDRLDTLIYRRELEKNGAKLVSVTEYVPEGADGILLEGLLTAMAEHYSANLSKLTLRGMYGNAERCHWNGVPCYGYRPDAEGHYEVFEPEAVHVRALFQLAAANNTIGELKRYCHEHDIRTTTGKPASSNMIYTLLRNRKYIGEYSWGEVVIPDGMPAIIDRDTFEKVRNRPKISGKASRADYFLVGKAFCDKGCGLTGAKAGKSHYYYVCKHRRIRKDVLESTIAHGMRETVTRDVLEAVVDKMLADDGIDSAKESMKSELRETEKALSGLLTAIEKGLDPDSVKDRFNELSRRKSELESRIADTPETPGRDELLEAAEVFMQIGEDRDLIGLFLDKVICGEDEIEIFFRVTCDYGCPDDGEDIFECVSSGGVEKEESPHKSCEDSSENLLAPYQVLYSKSKICVKMPYNRHFIGRNGKNYTART